MDDKRVEAFAAAYELGSLAAAARSLGIPYRKAQELVRDLEDEAGRALFLRTQWGVVPTGPGRDRYAGLPRAAERRPATAKGGGL